MKRGFKIFEKSITNRNKSEAFSKYLTDISKIQLFDSNEDELKCAFKAKNGNVNALNELVRRNLRFVVSVAKQYEAYDAPIEDLVNQGNMGLCEAATKFNPETGFKFISYAVWYVRKEMLLYLKEFSRQIRLPQNRFSELSKFNREIDNLTQNLERKPDILDMYGVLPNCKDSQVEIISNLSNMRVSSLDKPLVNERGSSTVGDMLSSESESTDSMFVNEKNKQLIKGILSKLKPRESFIIINLFGLNCPQKTLSDVAKELNLSSEAIRLIKRKTLIKLKKVCSDSGVKYFMF
jgi:RNA polymerase primary sigma factor